MTSRKNSLPGAATAWLLVLEGAKELYQSWCGAGEQPKPWGQQQKGRRFCHAGQFYLFVAQRDLAIQADVWEFQFTYTV